MHVDRAGVRDLVHRVQRVHRALEHDRQSLPSGTRAAPVGQRRACRTARRPPAVVDDLAAGDHAGRREQPGHAVRQGRLAAAALAGQAEHLAAVQGQVDVADARDGLVAEPVVDVRSRISSTGSVAAASAPRTRRCGWSTALGARARSCRAASETTGVKPTRIRMPALAASTLGLRPPLRRRGLTNSSMPKLISDSAVPSRAMAQAGRDEPPPGALRAAPAGSAPRTGSRPSSSRRCGRCR